MAPTIEHRPTFCRICEPLCGMIATVEDGKLTALRPDKEHPLSRGFACQKGIAFTEVQNDPDRVTRPLRRTTDGSFEPVDWDEALDDIAARLSGILRRHGSGGVGWYMGNPGAFSFAHAMWSGLFVKGLGPRSHYFTASSQDVSNRVLASQLLYGSPATIPVPDLSRTQLCVMLGANPVVSHGSMITAPRIKDHLHDIVRRGGRVLVVDPRKTETAAQFEWLGIRPDTDAFLLLALLQVMFGEGLADIAAIERQATGVDWLRRHCASFTPEAVAESTGIDPDTVRALARDLVRSPRASVYGRFGTSTGRNGTLTSYLIDAVNLVAGNLDRAGGAMFGSLGIPGQRLAMRLLNPALQRSYRGKRSRVGGFPRVIGSEPATMMAKEITTPGRGQIKALFVSAGNPVLSVPNGAELVAAAGQLELMVGLDFYLTETTALCDYVLPATTMYERDDFPVLAQGQQLTPFRQASAAVVEPAGEAKPEWEIIDALIQRMARRRPAFAAVTLMRKGLRLFDIDFGPRLVMDAVIRLADGGDRFGLRRGGLNYSRLVRQLPHGVVVEPHLRENVLPRTVPYRGGRVKLVHDDIAGEMAKLWQRRDPVDFPLRLIGMREPRSENSWMHNSPLLMRGDRAQRALVHVDDAAELSLADGDTVTVSSPWGRIEVVVRLTKDLVPGVVAVPHGWGHDSTGGWRVANRAGGANVNVLMSTAPQDIEALAGMAWLTGVPVRLERPGPRRPLVWVLPV
jgi:anaerobic selenocysteine-containing dehydrogenase